MAKLRVIGLSFEHMHMGDNLKMAASHSDCEVVAICDAQRERMTSVQQELGLSDQQVFTNWQECVDQVDYDWVILCPSTGDHATWVERMAPFGKPLLLEKPMAASLDDADRMLRACEKHATRLAINWPLVWVPSHRTAKRCIDEGRIGEVREVHYYDGNRGPLWHTSGKVEQTPEQVEAAKPKSWFYQRESGGGSLQDYLGYGSTLGTWFLDGRKPIEITCVVDQPHDDTDNTLEVDEHSVTLARYEFGISKFETRWGTFTDPWTHQPQPKCGFVLVGTEGTISSYDYEPSIEVQTRNSPAGKILPVDDIQAPYQNPVQYFVDCLQNDRAFEGPLSPELSRIGQQIVDTAVQSAREKRTLELIQ